MNIIVSTPYMDEAGLCDRVALMAGGEIFRIGSPDEICASFSGDLFALKNLPFALLAPLRDLPEVKSAFLFGESVHLRLKSNADFGVDFKGENLAQNLAQFLREKLHCDSLEVTQISQNIEDCFM